MPYELIIVDNGSSPEAAEWARDAADVPVLHDRNLGFAPGMNSGLAVAKGDIVLFVNNDTVFPAGWAASLLDAFERHPDAGIVLPAVTGGANPFAVRQQPGSGIVKVPPYRELPSGVVYALPRAFAESIGGWDERFEVASREDLDMLFTTWALGRAVVLDERVLVEHVGNATASTQLADRQAIWMRNWQVFIEKWTNDDPTAGHPDTVPERLLAAQVAAHWLDRWYGLFVERQELKRELAMARRAHPPPSTGTAPPGNTQARTLVRRIRRRVSRFRNG